MISKETRIEVKTFLVSQNCECGGEFKPTGSCYTTCPPQYPHLCDKCGNKKCFSKTYPSIEYDKNEE